MRRAHARPRPRPRGATSRPPVRAAFGAYSLLNLPASAFCTAVTRTCLSSLFSTAVPTKDSGTALSVLDVCSSAVGVVSPLYGGLLLSHLGVSAQPAIATAHYVLLLAASHLVLDRFGAAKKDKPE